MTSSGRKPEAIHVHYGLDGHNFIPVFQFLDIDPNPPHNALPIGGYYVANKGKLQSINAGDAHRYMDLYLDTVYVKRRTSVWDTLRQCKVGEKDCYSDPLGEWFGFNEKLDRLMYENPTRKYLVLQCISEEACYSSLAGLTDVTGRGNEFRHMIAWYTLDGNKNPLLGTIRLEDTVDGHHYQSLAVDLGHLCPPRCK